MAMNDLLGEEVTFQPIPKADAKAPTNEEILKNAFRACKAKGYDPVLQIAGYFLTEDPIYIADHLNARAMITHIDRDEALYEMVRVYFEHLMAEDRTNT